MKLNKKILLAIPVFISCVILIFWVATDSVRPNSYMLGMFRGIIWTTIYYSLITIGSWNKS